MQLNDGPPLKLNILLVGKLGPYPVVPPIGKIASQQVSYAVVKGAEIVATVKWQGSVPSSFLDLLTLQY